jgi:predicted TIM-barrel fold metal-dependent hydrolase
MSKVPVLFDVNGSFGKPAAGTPDFPTIASRLAFMDRLGIGRALVWNVEAVQNHALGSNRRLIEEIARTPGAAGRIVPALTVSGLMTYERDGVAALVRQMKTAGTRALRFTNVFGRLTLDQIEPIIRRIRPLRPFIVLRHDAAAVSDILDFAAAFPEIPLILTEVSWGPCITVFNLMRRRRNILVDNSWLHSYGAIELVVKRFGADRLVFGTGSRSHNGAAIAALARADLRESDRRAIAHGNLDRLMGTRSRPLADAPRPAAGNTLWPRYLAGEPLGVDVVDAHAHLGPSAGYVLEAQEEEDQIAAAVKDMKAVGMKTMIVSGLHALLGAPAEGNERLESACRPAGDRFKGYLSFNPGYAGELVPRFDRYFGGRFFVGFKTLCDYWRVPITDKRFEPMWAYASRHRLPVLSHTWQGTYDSPAMFEELAKRYPRVPFILGHSGGVDGGRTEAEDLARRYRNVYLEWCGSFCSARLWEETLKTVSPRQIVFGTDAMAHGIHWELGRLLSVDAPDRVLTPILGGNMRRLLAARKAD